jgi:Protein of unknown function (DUF4232)
VKNALLVVPLLSAGLLAAGCAASSTTPSGPGAAGGGTSATSSSAPASASSGASSTGASGTGASPTGSSTAAGSGTSGTTTASSGTPACTSADLQASLGGGAGAGMSQNHTGLQLRNTGSSACTLYGYPGVSWVRGATGIQTGAAAVRQADPSGTETTVTLAPGALASAPLDIDAAVISPSECKPVAVRGLRIYPPGEKAALFLSLPTTAGGYGECSLTTKSPTLMIGYLEAGVQPGGGAQG